MESSNKEETQFAGLSIKRGQGTIEFFLFFSSSGNNLGGSCYGNFYPARF